MSGGLSPATVWKYSLSASSGTSLHLFIRRKQCFSLSCVRSIFRRAPRYPLRSVARLSLFFGLTGELNKRTPISRISSFARSKRAKPQLEMPGSIPNTKNRGFPKRPILRSTNSAISHLPFDIDIVRLPPCTDTLCVDFHPTGSIRATPRLSSNRDIDTFLKPPSVKRHTFILLWTIPYRLPTAAKGGPVAPCTADTVKAAYPKRAPALRAAALRPRIEPALAFGTTEENL